MSLDLPVLMQLSMDTTGISLFSLLQHQLEYHLYQKGSCPSSSEIVTVISDVELKGVAVVIKNCHAHCFVDAMPRINHSTS